MHCPNCGAQISESSIEESVEYKPIGMWEYFGYEILFRIPIAGFIFLIIFSLGGTHNKNLKNFARSYFCIFILIAIASIVAFVLCDGILAGVLTSYEFS